MLVLLLMMLAVAPSANVVQGKVVIEGTPVPGVGVSLIPEGPSTITNVGGLYAFHGVKPGSYDIEFKLEGFRTERHGVVLGTVRNDQPDQELAPVVNEDIVFDCGSPCSRHTSPATKWDRPHCGEYDLDTALEESLKLGDRSALALLQTRRETTFTLGERHRIDGMLLWRVQDDSGYWRELSDHAEDALRFAGTDDATRAKFSAFCAERGLDEDGYAALTYNTLMIASADARSHAMLLRALDSEDPGIVIVAIGGLAVQHDLQSLDAIDRALSRLKDEARIVAAALAAFDSDSADRIAMKYIEEQDHESYLEMRRNAHESVK